MNGYEKMLKDEITTLKSHLEELKWRMSQGFKVSWEEYEQTRDLIEMKIEDLFEMS